MIQIFFLLLFAIYCIYFAFLINLEPMKLNKINTYTPIYYINLDHQTDRRKNIIELIDMLGFKNVKRIPAVKVKYLEDVEKYKTLIDPEKYKNLLENNKNNSRKNHYDLTNGSVGCFLSHINIYKDIITRNIPYAIVFEDDLVIKDSKQVFWNKINNIDIPADTDIFLVDAIIKDKNLKDGINKINFFFLTTFYIITNKGAKTILENIFPIKFQIDSQLSSLSYKNKIKIYGVKGNLINTSIGTMGSDIQNLSCKDCPMNDDELMK